MHNFLPRWIQSLAALLLIGSSTSHAQYAERLIARGDVSDATFNASEALKDYLPAEKLDPTNAALLVRIARQYRHLMTDAKDHAIKLRLGHNALDYGQRAAVLAPMDSEAQLSTAITYGKMLPYLPTKEQVAASPRIKVAADKAIKLDPRNDVAWHVLGRWHLALANVGVIKRSLGQLLYGKLPTSTHEQALACFDKAIAINPARMRHYVELGRTYGQMGQTANARRYLKQGLAMPNVEKDDPEIKQRGRDALTALP